MHDVGTKVYLHTYNNEKKGTGQINKKKILGFEPTTTRVVGEPTPDWAMEAVSVPPEN